MRRRTFLGGTGAALCSVVGRLETQAAVEATPPRRLSAGDQVTLGNTKVITSRLSVGTGTWTVCPARGPGRDGLRSLLRHAVDRGVRGWDLADSYKTHPHVRAALTGIERDRMTITSKTLAADRAGAMADVERFRREMGTEYIDVVLLHCLTDANWCEAMKGPMDALSEAKAKGLIRAVGCSCHTLGALEAAVQCDWVEVVLARFNPFGIKMGVDSPKEIDQVVNVLDRLHRQGKAVCGMKILGEGRLHDDQINESLRFALSKPFLTSLVVGFDDVRQLDDMIRRIGTL